MQICVRTFEDSDREWASTLLRDRWGSPRIVSLGRVHQADELPGLVAELNGERLGLLTYNFELDECEVVSLDSLLEGQGVASELLFGIENRARRLGCKRLWLIATNDNTHAIDFYQQRGFTLRAIHPGSMAEARRLKTEIPTHNAAGTAIIDEWEFERWLSPDDDSKP
jgi:ribosomal protein S18 acetylase RimI-like enzyme